ncbi:hypothetical protein NSK_003785 [Nannochloropsis salina CCMP1776]|uniref:30S ribosomal protein S15 n=1 Tax=Nannochloropsis salina CCMP1776 TaxID=1027361 RepID=A0A4D9D3Z7_9STRA|nr:hypothetical protein NSK_003785 [Nannochloropsis salina CCMP1776]|eukprot:TFJ84753.1 hypothetical protein NSK_003785 [Nannochloropsis salina CCMP1776]
MLLPKGILVSCLITCAVAFVPPMRGPRSTTVSKSVKLRLYASGPEAPGGSQLVPEDDEEMTEGFTEIDGVVFEGDFEDDSVKPSLTSLLEDVGDDGSEAFKLDSDDSFFSIPDYVPSELPDLAALGSGLESKRDMMNEFVEGGEFDPNDEKMYRLLGLDALDEKKTRKSPEDFTLPGGYLLEQARLEVAQKYQKHDKDVGSSAVQVAQFTQTISYLTKHVQVNPRDYSARRGLIRAVNIRRKLLNYISKRNKPFALKLAAELGIRFRPPDGARSKFEMYRFYKNTKSKKAKNMQSIADLKAAAEAQGVDA